MLKFKANKTEHDLNSEVDDMEGAVETLKASIEDGEHENIMSALQDIAQHCSNIGEHILDKGEDDDV